MSEYFLPREYFSKKDKNLQERNFTKNRKIFWQWTNLFPTPKNKWIIKHYLTKKIYRQLFNFVIENARLKKNIVRMTTVFLVLSVLLKKKLLSFTYNLRRNSSRWFRAGLGPQSQLSSFQTDDVPEEIFLLPWKLSAHFRSSQFFLSRELNITFHCTRNMFESLETLC